MYKSILLIAFSLFLSISTILAQSVAEELQKIRVDVIYLASNYMEGRETGKMGEKLAAQYIISRFREIGLDPMGDDNTYRQFFDFVHYAETDPDKEEARTGQNIIGYLDNQASQTIVIGAHYDHIGFGDFASKSQEERSIHNGADDNASGVALMLYLAKALKKAQLKNNNYLFIAFSGEEMGLHGSQYFLKNPGLNSDQFNCMLNLNRVGHLDESKKLIINGIGTSPAWKETIPRIEPEGLSIITTESGIGGSDHNSFYLANIPALHFTTGEHEDYHTPQDDSEAINFDGIVTTGNYILRLITQLNRLGKFPFTPTLSSANQQTAPKYKVSLGVRPSYLSTSGGVLIEGVISDRPGEKAGVQVGDIVIQMGDQKIENIYDYMDGLSQFNAGEKAVLMIKRNGKEMKLEVTF